MNIKKIVNDLKSLFGAGQKNSGNDITQTTYRDTHKEEREITLPEILGRDQNKIIADTYGTVINFDGKPIVDNIKALIDAHQKGFLIIQCSSDLIDFEKFKGFAKENQDLWAKYVNIIEKQKIFYKENIEDAVKRVASSEGSSHTIYFDDRFSIHIYMAMKDHKNKHCINSSNAKALTETVDFAVNKPPYDIFCDRDGTLISQKCNSELSKLETSLNIELFEVLENAVKSGLRVAIVTNGHLEKDDILKHVGSDMETRVVKFLEQVPILEKSGLSDELKHDRTIRIDDDKAQRHSNVCFHPEQIAEITHAINNLGNDTHKPYNNVTFIGGSSPAANKFHDAGIV